MPLIWTKTSGGGLVKWQPFKGTVHILEKWVGIKTLPNHTVLLRKHYKVLFREEQAHSELIFDPRYKAHKVKNVELPQKAEEVFHKITEMIEALSDEAPTGYDFKGTDRTLNSKSSPHDSADVRKYHQDSQGNMYRSDSEVKGQFISGKTHKNFKEGIESTLKKKTCLDKEQKLKEKSSDGNLHNASGKTGEKVPLESQNLFRKIHYMSQNRESLDNMAADEQGIMKFADRSQLNQVGISEVTFGDLLSSVDYSRILENKPTPPKGEGSELAG